MKKLVLILSLFLCSVTEAKFINFSFNPFGATVGLNSYALDLKLAKKLTIGVTYTDIDYNEFLSVSQTGEMLGGRIMIYFNEALADSWWLRLEGGNLDTNLVVKDIFSQAITATGTAEGSYYSAMLGYMWM